MTCTGDILHCEIEGATCAERIFFIMLEDGGDLNELDACWKIAGHVFSEAWKSCDLDRCQKVVDTQIISDFDNTATTGTSGLHSTWAAGF